MATDRIRSVEARCSVLNSGHFQSTGGVLDRTTAAARPVDWLRERSSRSCRRSRRHWDSLIGDGRWMVRRFATRSPTTSELAFIVNVRGSSMGSSVAGTGISAICRSGLPDGEEWHLRTGLTSGAACRSSSLARRTTKTSPRRSSRGADLSSVTPRRPLRASTDHRTTSGRRRCSSSSSART